MARNGVIGRNGDLPWRLPEDLAHFRRTTLGHAVIMGRKTWESLPKPLPGRHNIVVSGQADYAAQGADVAGSLEAARALVDPSDELPFVIGGASLYAQALPEATVVHWTEVDSEPAGDTHFPAWDRRGWTEVRRRPGRGCAFVTLRRVTDD